MHGTYSRIDYILVDHRLLERVVEARCEILTLSDHAPITMKISTSIQKCIPPEWRLDEGLLRDEDVVERVQKELEWYFQENDKEGITGATLWDAHKAYIRGIFIAEGAKKSKMRRSKLKTLKEEIYRLEQEHKLQGQKRETLRKLTLTRDEYKALAGQETKNFIDRVERERYVWGNKPSKNLARMVRKKKTRNFIEKIRNGDGDLVYATNKIAESFRSYYEKLYNVQQKIRDPAEKKDKIRKVLRQTNLPKIEEYEIERMEESITEQEISEVLKILPTGKARDQTASRRPTYKGLVLP